MTHSPAHVVLAYLAAQNLAVIVDKLPTTGGLPAGKWAGYLNAMADAYDNAIAVYDTASVMDGRARGEVIEHPGISIRVRSNAGDIGWARSVLIKTKLDSIRRTSVSLGGKSYTIQNAKRTTGIVPLGPGKDEARYLHTLNAILTIKEN